MRSQIWKRLLRDLPDAGHESPYKDRMLARVDAQQAQQDLQREIMQEMASALGRAEGRVMEALLQMCLLETELDALWLRSEEVEQSVWRERVNHAVRAYNQQREVAERCRWEMMMQREALGSTRNEVLNELYPIPPGKKEFPR